MEKQYVKLTPKMTSNTTPSGRCFDSSNAGSYYLPYFAFDERNDFDRNTWATVNDLPQWIAYQFPEPVRVRRLITVNRNEDPSQYQHNNRAVSAFTLQASNDGQNWINIGKFTSSNRTGHYKNIYDFNNSYKYFYYRLYVTGNFNNASGTGCGFAEIGMYDTVDIDAAGDIGAIADWFKGTRYSKDIINIFFIYNNTYTPYAIKFVGSKDQRVKIVGQTSQQSYEIVLDSNGKYSNLLFFIAMETLDISIEGIYSHKQAILPSTNVLTINLAKIYHIYKDGQIINNKSVQIDTHTTGHWHPDTGTAAVTNANNKLMFNAWPSNTYFRESYIRTGVPVYDGDVAVLKYETNYAVTNNETYNPVKNVNSDGELVITFLQPVWDMVDYRNKFQYFGMQWLDQNDDYRPLFLDPDPNSPMLRVQYGIYMYQPGDSSLVSISELTAVVYGVPEVETAI